MRPLLALVCLLVASWSCPALAQVVVPEPPSVQLTPPEALRRGQPAPRDGLFVEVPTYLGLISQIERLEYLVGTTLRAERATCERLVEIERLRTAHAADRLTLRETLWQQRQNELLTQIEERRRAAEREWHEHPVLWIAVGGAIVGAIVGAAAIAAAN